MEHSGRFSTDSGTYPFNKGDSGIATTAWYDIDTAEDLAFLYTQTHIGDATRVERTQKFYSCRAVRTESHKY